MFLPRPPSLNRPNEMPSKFVITSHIPLTDTSSAPTSIDPRYRPAPCSKFGFNINTLNLCSLSVNRPNFADPDRRPVRVRPVIAQRAASRVIPSPVLLPFAPLPFPLGFPSSTPRRPPARRLPSSHFHDRSLTSLHLHDAGIMISGCEKWLRLTKKAPTVHLPISRLKCS